jgi:hypothetical protein
VRDDLSAVQAESRAESPPAPLLERLPAARILQREAEAQKGGVMNTILCAMLLSVAIARGASGGPVEDALKRDAAITREKIAEYGTAAERTAGRIARIKREAAEAKARRKALSDCGLKAINDQIDCLKRHRQELQRATPDNVDSLIKNADLERELCAEIRKQAEAQCVLDHPL